MRLPVPAAAWVLELLAEDLGRPVLAVMPHEVDAYAWLEAARLFADPRRTDGETAANLPAPSRRTTGFTANNNPPNIDDSGWGTNAIHGLPPTWATHPAISGPT